MIGLSVVKVSLALSFNLVLTVLPGGSPRAYVTNVQGDSEFDSEGVDRDDQNSVNVDHGTMTDISSAVDSGGEPIADSERIAAATGKARRQVTLIT